MGPYEQEIGTIAPQDEEPTSRTLGRLGVADAEN
jgi:hypothetical protein